jgi:hypothetical protein
MDQNKIRPEHINLYHHFQVRATQETRCAPQATLGALGKKHKLVAAGNRTAVVQCLDIKCTGIM